MKRNDLRPFNGPGYSDSPARSSHPALRLATKLRLPVVASALVLAMLIPAIAEADMYSLTMSKQTFSGSDSKTPPAGQHTEVELQNPAGSGVNLIVWQVNLLTASASSVGFKYESTYTLSPGGTSPNMFAGGPNSVVTEQLTTVSSPPGGASFNLQTPSLADFPFALNPVAVIPPGGGLLIMDNIPGDFMWVAYFFSQQ